MAGRRENVVKSHSFEVSVSTQIWDLLGKIAASGYAARSENTVAEEMIRKGLNADGLISQLVRERVTKKVRK